MRSEKSQKSARGGSGPCGYAESNTCTTTPSEKESPACQLHCIEEKERGVYHLLTERNRSIAMVERSRHNGYSAYGGRSSACAWSQSESPLRTTVPFLRSLAWTAPAATSARSLASLSAIASASLLLAAELVGGGGTAASAREEVVGGAGLRRGLSVPVLGPGSSELRMGWPVSAKVGPSSASSSSLNGFSWCEESWVPLVRGGSTGGDEGERTGFMLRLGGKDPPSGSGESGSLGRRSPDVLLAVDSPEEEGKAASVAILSARSSSFVDSASSAAWLSA